MTDQVRGDGSSPLPSDCPGTNINSPAIEPPRPEDRRWPKRGDLLDWHLSRCMLDLTVFHETIRDVTREYLESVNTTSPASMARNVKRASERSRDRLALGVAFTISYERNKIERMSVSELMMLHYDLYQTLPAFRERFLPVNHGDY